MNDLDSIHDKCKHFFKAHACTHILIPSFRPLALPSVTPNESRNTSSQLAKTTSQAPFSNLYTPSGLLHGHSDKSAFNLKDPAFEARDSALNIGIESLVLWDTLTNLHLRFSAVYTQTWYLTSTEDNILQAKIVLSKLIAPKWNYVNGKYMRNEKLCGCINFFLGAPPPPPRASGSYVELDLCGC
jgi:hypothetical protein